MLLLLRWKGERVIRSPFHLFSYIHSLSKLENFLLLMAMDGSMFSVS